MLATREPSNLIVLRGIREDPQRKSFTWDDDACCWKAARTDMHGLSFFVETFPAGTTDQLIESLMRVVTRAGPDSSVIRGALQKDGGDLSTGVERRLLGEGGPWTEIGRTWVALDFDGVPTPPGLPDEERSAWLMGNMGKRWKDAGYFWQATSRHRCTPAGASVSFFRIWCALSQAMTGPALRELLGGEQTVTSPRYDPSVFRTIQPIFLAPPLFIGGPGDPIKCRFGARRGPEVNVDDVSMAARLVTKVAAVPTAPAGAARGTATRNDAQNKAHEICAIRGVTIRHEHLLGLCSALYVCGATEQEAKDALRTFLANNPEPELGRTPTPGELDRTWTAVLRKESDGTLYTREKPLSVIIAEAVKQEADNPTGENKDLQAASATFGVREDHNADLLVQQDVVQDRPWVYAQGQLHRWGGVCYEAMNDDEFAAHVALRVGRKNVTNNAAIVRYKRMLIGAWEGRSGLVPGQRTDGEPTDPLVRFSNGWVWMDDYLMDRHTCLTPAQSVVFVLNKPSVPFDLEARCPTWLAFLEAIWPGDEGQKRELQKMFGLLMTPVTKYQKLFWLLGATGGGKGTIMDVIKGLLEHQASSMPITAFADNFGKQQLVGKTVCLVDEANDTQAVPMASIDFIKSVAGEGQTQIDRKFLEPFVGQLQCRFVFASNHFPAIADSSGAFGRRIHLFSFYKSFKDKPDDTLRGRLLAELAGIAQWALAGLWLLMVEDGGFRTTEAAKAKWEILQFRLAKVGAAISSFLVADPEGRLPVSAFRELLSRYYRATGWERAAEPDPRLAEEVMTHFATAGSTLTAEQDDHGKLHLIGVSWSPSGRKSLQEYGLDPSGVALDNDTKVK